MDTKRIKTGAETHKKIKIYAAANGMTMTDALTLAVSLLVDGLPEVAKVDLKAGDFFICTDDGLGGGVGLYCGVVYSYDGILKYSIDGNFAPLCDLPGIIYGPIPRPKTKSTA